MRFLLLLVSVARLWHVFASPTGFSVQDARPKYPTDPNATPYCQWWWDNDGSVSCEEMLEYLEIPMVDFVRWVSFTYLVDSFDDSS